MLNYLYTSAGCHGYVKIVTALPLNPFPHSFFRDLSNLLWEAMATVIALNSHRTAFYGGKQRERALWSHFPVILEKEDRLPLDSRKLWVFAHSSSECCQCYHWL